VKEASFLRITRALTDLKQVRRQGWIQTGTTDVESVADHSFGAAFLAFTLSAGTQLDRDKVVKLALIHDLAESVTGDIIYESGKDVVGPIEAQHATERKVMETILEGLDEEDKLLTLWDEWSKQETPEAVFVRRVEKIEMANQALDYERRTGPSKKFDEFWENAEKYLKGSELESLYNALVSEREKLHKKK